MYRRITKMHRCANCSHSCLWSSNVNSAIRPSKQQLFTVCALTEMPTSCFQACP